MAEIILDRSDQNNMMNLNEDELALLDDIEVDKERTINVSAPKRPSMPAPRRRPPPSSQRRPQMMEDEDEEPEMDAFINQTKRTAPSRPPPEVEDYGEEEEEDDDEYPQADYQGGGGGGGGGGEEPSEGYSSIDDEKADLLNKLTRLEKKGFNVNKKLNAYSSISELRTEYKRITYSIEVDSSIKFSRRMLVACVSGLEFLNKRYNPVDVYLDGWSENVVENLDDYDGVFEELYNKYKTKMQVAPEVKLIMMLGGSAMMFHLTNSMFKAAVPNMNDVLKKNPDLVKNMVEAVQNSGSPQVQAQAPASVDENGRREMRGPGVDLSQLMGGMMMPPPPPMNTSQKTGLDSVVEVSGEDDDDDDDISDIVSISGDSTGGELKDVSIKPGGGRRRRSKKKKEISL
jgi:hypothetical protein